MLKVYDLLVKSLKLLKAKSSKTSLPNYAHQDEIDATVFTDIICSFIGRKMKSYKLYYEQYVRFAIAKGGPGTGFSRAIAQCKVFRKKNY